MIDDLSDSLHIAQRKTVHVQLDRDVHLKIKWGLTKYALSMQDFFHFLAENAVNDPEYEKILFNAHKRKVERAKEKNPNQSGSFMGKLDRQSLYEIIENEEKVHAKRS